MFTQYVHRPAGGAYSGQDDVFGRADLPCVISEPGLRAQAAQRVQYR